MLRLISITFFAIAQPQPAKLVRTLLDQSMLLEQVWVMPDGEKQMDGNIRVVVDPGRTFQVMEGFGGTMTGGSAQHLMSLSEGRRSEVFDELFGTKPGQIGMSYLRVSVGASDLDEEVWSYGDLPEGVAEDLSLDYFDLNRDTKFLVPVLKEAFKRSTDLSLMASPWSAPVWMKDNKKSQGGSLLPRYEEVYAQYLVRYLQEMKALGIEVDALTVQNEPLHPGNNPSMLMRADQQARFIGRYLGPMLKELGLKTQILAYDHNADRPDYPLEVLGDSMAHPYVAGSAFHLYGGNIEALSEVHDAYPEKDIYFTEQWIGAPGNFAGDFAWHMKNLFIGAPNNWSKTVLEWNIASDSQWRPFTPGGCSQCLGVLTIEGDEIVRNPAYYLIGQIAPYARPGAYRISTEGPKDIPQVAFKNADGSVVVLGLWEGKGATEINVLVSGENYTVTMPSAGAFTLVIPAKP
jgi:glucosylceramidase